MGRARKIAESDNPVDAKILFPAAINHIGRIDDSQLANETVSKVRDELFSKEGDIVVKASTPYDCAFIDKGHEGLLVTSFGIILRSSSQALIDMRYLAAFLGLGQDQQRAQNEQGMTIKLIRSEISQVS